MPYIRISGLLFLFCLFTVSASLYAQQKPVQPAKPSAGAAVQSGAAAEKDFFSYQSASGTLFNAGGGYYSALGDMAAILKPSWSVRLTAQNNNMADTLFGLGLDCTYAMLKDTAVQGGIVYTTVHPNVTATFSFFDWFDVQAKAGPGISILTSTINDSVSPNCRDDSHLIFCRGGRLRIGAGACGWRSD